MATTKKTKTATLGLPKLTRRELQILKFICREHTNKEIGEKLYISSRTVEGYRQQLLEKTGARNTAGLVMFAMKNLLVR
ncbi:MAG: response regulator transcription factor [Bacteroidetes bacterium]|nr:response regulator transcription factor [Bacteroidota bacterium]